MNCRDTCCKQHPDYYKEEARNKATYMQLEIGKKVRAYKDLMLSCNGNHCIHGRLVKVFVKGNSVAYKVKDQYDGSIVTCSFVEVTLFQDL
jgi:hypothetical protein